MRRFHGVILAAALLPVAGFAQDAVIRVEAKRGAAAVEAAADRWRQAFDDVVTFPLPGGWTGIALGPMTADAASARLAELIAAGQVPADSFVTVPGGDKPLRPVAPAAGAATGSAAPPAVSVPPSGMDLGAMSAPPPAAAGPDRHIRLQALEDRAAAEAAFARWRETFPEAALWRLPNGWFAIALGPMTEAVGTAWLTAFKDAGQAPGDAFLAATAELGAPVVAGGTIDLPAPPPEAATMPPLDEVQRALRWAGRYEGPIDGRNGPKTRAAIAAEVAEQRLSPDPGTAMRRLIDRRADWRGDMGLTTLEDAHTGLRVTAPMDRLVFDRAERALSIYAPRDGSGAALILFSQPGGQQELLDLSGLVTALGWVPQPRRLVEPGHVLLAGQNETHMGQAEGWVRDGRAEGYVLIWPAADAANQPRIAAELSDSLARHAPAANDPQPAAADAPAVKRAAQRGADPAADPATERGADADPASMPASTPASTPATPAGARPAETPLP